MNHIIWFSPGDSIYHNRQEDKTDRLKYFHMSRAPPFVDRNQKRLAAQ